MVRITVIFRMLFGDSFSWSAYINARNTILDHGNHAILLEYVIGILRNVVMIINRIMPPAYTALSVLCRVINSINGESSASWINNTVSHPKSTPPVRSIFETKKSQVFFHPYPRNIFGNTFISTAWIHIYMR